MTTFRQYFRKEKVPYVMTDAETRQWVDAAARKGLRGGRRYREAARMAAEHYENIASNIHY